MSSRSQRHSQEGVTEPAAGADAPVLTAAGQRRREAMLGELTAELHQVRRQRAVRRGIVGIASVVLLVSGAVTVARLPTARVPRAPLAHQPAATPRPAPAERVIQITSTDMEILDRWSPPKRDGFRVEPIDDDTLLRRLAEIGRPAGLIRMDGRARLSAAVTDAELAHDGATRDGG